MERAKEVFLLNAQTGSIKGSSWAIGADVVTVGRSPECGILIRDSLVSRRHCEIFTTDQGLLVRDLGSSNATLVNGKPVRECALNAGDELAVGRTVLLVTATNSEPREEDEGPGDSTTVNLAEDQSAFIGDNTAELIAMAYPNSVQDLAGLYDIGRKCSRVLTVKELMKTVFEELRERFRPSAVWIARVRPGQTDLDFYTRHSCATEETVEAPSDVERKAHKALKKREGLVVPIFSREFDERRLATLLVAPIALGEVQIGAILMRCEAYDQLYGEGDLRFLLSVANTVAPYFRAVEQVEQLRRDNERLREMTRSSMTLVGKSRAIRQVRSLIRNAAPSDLSILIQGETGTGKELAAVMVHELSPRASGPLITVNCAAIPHHLLESELFGHEKGAFTGAVESRAGRLDQANGGTLFLDEIGDLSLENQAKMLRVIESGTFRRLGGNRETHVDVRVVAATNKNLAFLAKRGQFREDLYHRINGFEVVMPTLRDRPSDIPILAEFFLRQSLNRAKRPLSGFTDSAMTYLRAQKWPGNVRQLRNAVERAVAVARADYIDEEDLQASSRLGLTREEEAAVQSLAEMEKRHIVRVLDRCNGSVREAARVLDIGRSTLYGKISDYHIEV